MTQNIYDDEAFFDGYARLPRSVGGFLTAAEWPSLQALLPPLQGRRVIDLGCGAGRFCHWARAEGAASVRGYDVSERMLALARDAGSDPAVTFLRADLETVGLTAASADLVYSSLALHYVVDYDRLVGEIATALVPGGTLVANIEHPMLTAPAEAAWITLPSGRKLWPIDSYLEEGPRVTDWITKGVVKQHRSMTTMIGALLRHGLVLRHIEEWGPTDAELAARPSLMDERRRPTFLLLAADKP